MRSIRPLSWLAGGLAVALAVPALASAASISQVGTGFSGPGLLRPGGVVLIGGLVRCTDGPVRIAVTITQPGRRAKGTWRGPCTGANQRWGRVAVRPATRARLRPGIAQACASATIRKPGLSVGTGWCNPVRLVRA